MVRERKRINSIERGEPQYQEDKPQSTLLFYFTLFQYSTKYEKFIMALAIFLAAVTGCVPSAVNVLYGEFCTMLMSRQYPADYPLKQTVIMEWFGGGRIIQNASAEERRELLEEDSIAWAIGCGTLTLFQFALSVLSVAFMCIAASRQISRIKILFFKSILCKDMAWFDSKLDGSFAAKSSKNLYLLERGIAELPAVITFQIVVGLVNVVVSFFCNWILSLLLMMFIIAAILSVILKLKFQGTLSRSEIFYNGKADSIAEEVFTLIKTVVAFGGEKKEVERYYKYLKKSREKEIKRGLISGISNGVLWFIIYSCYGTAFFYGTRLILTSRELRNEDFTPSDLLIVLFGMLTGLTNFGFVAGHLETMSVACSASVSIFQVIKSKSTINQCSKNGEKPDSCRGEIEFRNVRFKYPSRAGEILKGINLKINAGEKVAIVGESGSGKTTLLQLIQRLYDPNEGEVLLDGQNIKSFKVSWLREQMGVVYQEPLLFATSIRENIAFGFPLATNKDIEEAAQKANAHEFIENMTEKYDTVVGQRGVLLSGGQKQRIAIARALVRNPTILLLDEATSALDAISEKVVQEALDKATEGRTTLIVTHKLSTIENVRRIIVLENGTIAEEGTHDKLVEMDGLYKKLLKAQAKNRKERRTERREISMKQIIFDGPNVPAGRYSSGIYNFYPPEIGTSFPDTGETYKKASYFDLVKWSKPEKCYLVVGFAASIIGGTALPGACIILGGLFGLLSLTDSTVIIKQTDLYSSFLVVIGLLSGFCIFLQIYCLSVAGAKFSTRIRYKYFECMVHQEISWFEEEKNKVGVLCLRLSEDASEMQKGIGTPIGVLIQGLSSLFFGAIVCFFFNWKITLVSLCTVPFIFFGVHFESVFSGQSAKSTNKSDEKAAKIAVEVTSNVKTVSSLGNVSYFVENYTSAVKEGKKSNLIKAWLRGLTFAFGQTAPFFGYALTLWYGGHLVAINEIHYKYVITVSEILVFGAWTLGQSVIFTPSFSEIKRAVARVRSAFLNQRRTEEGSWSPNMFDEESYVKYSNVSFSYPNHPEMEILRNFNLLVKSGESVALVGPSGSGKSTALQLLLRFYKPSTGSVLINDVNITHYKLSTLRKLFGFVSQEPGLFNRSIKENIAYGDNTREVPLNEIIEVADAVNIHSFIESLPFGYDTVLRTGTQLSGGQKQRIAIARALVRKPRILLLDEATSALDLQSEDTVQEALDKVSMGRTTITVAHRIRAFRNADVIYVIEGGTITDSGTHEKLLQKHGWYYTTYGEDR